MFMAGFIYSVVGLFLGYFVFREIAGILMVFLIVIATVPLLYVTIKNEEELDLKYDKEFFLLKEHSKVLIFLMFMFLGSTLALVLAYVFLPQPMTDTIFSLQKQAIVNINQNIIEQHVTGNFTRFDVFTRIIINNFKVLFFCLIFSFLYGTGAVFILTWNTSVIATAMGSFIKIELAKTASLVGFPSIAAYFGVATSSFLRYMTHGLFEIASYFIAGLAGGIISIAIIKHNFQEDRVFVDALDLILISIGMLVAAGLIETYITPLLFV